MKKKIICERTQRKYRTKLLRARLGKSFLTWISLQFECSSFLSKSKVKEFLQASLFNIIPLLRIVVDSTG